MSDPNHEPQNEAFKKIADEWLNALLVENADAKGVAEIMLVQRLGTLGQRLVYQAYVVGLDAALQALRESK